MAPSPSMEVVLPGPPRSADDLRGVLNDGPLPRTLRQLPQSPAAVGAPSLSESGPGPSRPGPAPGLVGQGHSLGEAGQTEP